MTATLTRSAAEIKCDFCEAPLTGGKDTYGDFGQSVCFLCWTAIGATSPNAKMANRHVARATFLKNLNNELDQRLMDAEEDLDEAQRTIKKLESRMAAIENELNGHGPCPEQEDAKP